MDGFVRTIDGDDAKTRLGWLDLLYKVLHSITQLG